MTRKSFPCDQALRGGHGCTENQVLAAKMTKNIGKHKRMVLKRKVTTPLNQVWTAEK